VFPGKDYMGLDGVDAVAGTLHGVPAVMPGFWGSHLGVIDLALKRTDGRWSVEKATVEARPVYRRNGTTTESLATADASVSASVAAAHAGTLTWIEQPVGKLEAPVHSYFVWAGYDPCSQLINAAQAWYAKPFLAGTAHADLPVLSAVAPFRAGYTPDSFIDIPAGQTSLRQVADLYLFSNNTIVATKVRGADVIEWLEAAARAFRTLDPAATEPQALVDKRVPSYNFDTIAGITYAIDVTKAARYDSRGTLDAGTRRIVDVRFHGKPIDLDREFIVVTNNYRGDGGGNFPGLTGGAKVVWRAPDTNQEALLRYFQAQQTITVSKSPVWSFAPAARGARVFFDTGVAATPYAGDVPGLSFAANSEPGYARAVLRLI
jgi:2',3'-cyclic-nucleotide 2'-phosphodiesterase / 3'-nucleotidase